MHAGTRVLPKERMIAWNREFREEIEEFRLDSHRARFSGECSKSNDSTLQKLVRVTQMLEKERLMGLDLLVSRFNCFSFIAFSHVMFFNDEKDQE